ncbi:hypothetical protein PG985_002269 [Apiospora marii]|uniref:uncharacterized protein n=1 Tax=Apiospora marii TaxID=335849 RepID=UPI003131E0B9
MPPASKRNSDDISVDASSSSKRIKTHEAIDLTGSDSEDAPADVNAAETARQQRLTTPDLEFDYDRSQLRDPRPTPGRVKRPRHDEYSLPKSEREKYRPPPPAKPKGRLNASQRSQLYKEEAIHDSAALYHDMYVCLSKGRRGSPTYDTAGFELDYDKVFRTLAPRAYNKRRIVKGMGDYLATAETFDSRMFDIFFEEGDEVMEKKKWVAPVFTNYVKDKISKDLGIPWHKIGVAELELWGQKGFPKEKLADWTVFSAEDKKRMSKMQGGSDFRK